MITVPAPGIYGPPLPGSPAASLLYELFRSRRIIPVEPTGQRGWEITVEAVAHASRWQRSDFPSSLVVPDIDAAEEAGIMLARLGVPASIRTWLRPSEVTAVHHRWHTMQAHLARTSRVPAVSIWAMSKRHPVDGRTQFLGPTAVHPDVDLCTCPAWPSPAGQLLLCGPVTMRVLEAARERLSGFWQPPIDHIPLEVILAGAPQ